MDPWGIKIKSKLKVKGICLNVSELSDNIAFLSGETKFIIMCFIISVKISKITPIKPYLNNYDV
jgi:hypothetical protein